jgi:hypothetical protein
MTIFFVQALYNEAYMDSVSVQGVCRQMITSRAHVQLAAALEHPTNQQLAQQLAHQDGSQHHTTYHFQLYLKACCLRCCAACHCCYCCYCFIKAARCSSLQLCKWQTPPCAVSYCCCAALLACTSRPRTQLSCAARPTAVCSTSLGMLRQLHC